MARAKSVVLSPAEKKVIVADLKAKLKLAKEDVKAANAASKDAYNRFTSSLASITKANTAKADAIVALKNAKVINKAANVDAKAATKAVGMTGKALAALEKQLAALAPPVAV